MHLLVLSAFRPRNRGGDVHTSRVSMHLLVLSAFRQDRATAPSLSASVSMHLLVLSAFRPYRHQPGPRGYPESQCTFWCSVLSDVGTIGGVGCLLSLSQCTFWCSVLSDDVEEALSPCSAVGLNAPFGAQCFPTWKRDASMWRYLSVSMHLLVLSAFRPSGGNDWRVLAQVSMHLLVLSAFRHRADSPGAARRLRLNAPFGAQCFPTSPGTPGGTRIMTSQCTFWCSVLSDAVQRFPRGHAVPVSMHLLVLSAFRRVVQRASCDVGLYCLNAPFGAQCFPTMDVNMLVSIVGRLNAPFGAQCFPTVSRIFLVARC